LIRNEILGFLGERRCPGAKSAGEVGYPSRVSRKGKAGPLETGRGKHSPPASLERITSEALKRRDSGVYPEETLETPLYLFLTKNAFFYRVVAPYLDAFG
jgi:hypothetical protein